MPTSHFGTLLYECGRSKRRCSETQLVSGPFSPCSFVFYCCSFIPCDLQPEMEDNASMLLERATESVCVRGLGVCVGGAGGGGGGQIGWEADGGGFVPSAQQKGDRRWPQAPPLPLTAFRETPYHPSSTVRFNTPPPPPTPSSSPTPNHTILDVESIIWILTVQPFVPPIKNVRCISQDETGENQI